MPPACPSSYLLSIPQKKKIAQFLQWTDKYNRSYYIASRRIILSAEERRNSLFTDDMYKDVAKEDLIFLQDSLESSNIQMAVEDNTVKNSIFAENTTEYFEIILNNITNGKERFNNLTEEENDVARRDRLLAAAGIQARRNGGANKEESQDARNERQERQVEEWAKQAGVWHDDAIAFGKSFDEELEGG